MLLAFIFSLFGGGDEGGFGGLSESEVRDLVEDSQRGGDNGLDDYTPPSGDTSSGGSGFTRPDVVSEIGVLDFAGSATVLSVQDMLDGDGYEQTTAKLAAEDERERTGVTLGEALRAAGIEDWNRVRVTGGFSATDLDRAPHDVDPTQYLLYWSNDDDPSPTVSFTNPQDGVRVTDVANIIVVN